jgi:hypothetical protein
MNLNESENENKNKNTINLLDNYKKAVTLSIVADGSAAIILFCFGIISMSGIPIMIGSAVIPNMIKFIVREAFEENAGINITAGGMSGGIKYITKNIFTSYADQCATNNPIIIEAIKGIYNGTAYEYAHNKDINESQAPENKTLKILQGTAIEICEFILETMLKHLFDQNAGYSEILDIAKSIGVSAAAGVAANADATLGFETVHDAVNYVSEALNYAVGFETGYSAADTVNDAADL